MKKTIMWIAFILGSLPTPLFIIFTTISLGMEYLIHGSITMFGVIVTLIIWSVLITKLFGKEFNVRCEALDTFNIVYPNLDPNSERGMKIFRQIEEEIKSLSSKSN